MTADLESLENKGKMLRFQISSISGRTATVECSALEETSWLLRSAAEALGFPWMGWGAYSLLVQNKLLTANEKLSGFPDLLVADGVIVATLVRRAGISVKVVHPSFTLNGAASSNAVDFTAATICGLRQDMHATLGMDFSDCQAVIAGLDLSVDEEVDLQSVAVNGKPVEKINFVGHVKRDPRPAPSIRWVLRELPSGEKYYEADFYMNMSTKEKGSECSGYDSSSSTYAPEDSGSSSSGESSERERKGNGKGVGPPLPTKAKGKGKGPERRRVITHAEKDVTAPLTLVPGRSVLTRLRFTDEIGRDGKEGVVIGWCHGEGAWIVRMLSGMDWLLRTEHLMARNARGRWAMATASADERSSCGAVDRLDPKVATVVRVSAEEDSQASKVQAIAAYEDSRRRTVEWAQQCALDRQLRFQVLLIEGDHEEMCIGSVCPKAGSKPADAKWDPSILLTFRPSVVGRVMISPVLRDLFAS